MIVTDEMVETALRGWFGPGFWKPEVTGAHTVAKLRGQMRAALEAAVAVAPTQPPAVPTREQIAEAAVSAGSRWVGLRTNGSMKAYYQADAVLGLFTKPEENQT